MREWQSQSHVRWYCRYHVVCVPKYRKRAIFGEMRRGVGRIVRELCQRHGVALVEGHALSDHVHVLLGIPPKLSVANTVGFLKGKSAIRIHREYLGRQRNFTGYHFWARWYCVSTVGILADHPRPGMTTFHSTPPAVYRILPTSAITDFPARPSPTSPLVSHPHHPRRCIEVSRSSRVHCSRVPSSVPTLTLPAGSVQPRCLQHGAWPARFAGVEQDGRQVSSILRTRALTCTLRSAMKGLSQSLSRQPEVDVRN